MPIPPERDTRDADVEAFFALSRRALYGSALGLLVLALGAAAAGVALGPWLGFWIVPAYPALATGLIALLRRSAPGRGALWTLGGRGLASSRSPRNTLRLWSALTVICLGLAWLGR